MGEDIALSTNLDTKKKSLQTWEKTSLIANGFLFSCQQSFLLTLFANLAFDLNLSLGDLSLAFALGSLFFSIGGPLSCLRADSSSKNTILGISLLGLSMTLFSLAALFWFRESSWILILLIGNRIIYGLFAAAINPISQIQLLDINSKKANPLYLNQISLYSGRIIGPILALTLSAHYLKILFFLALSSFLLAAYHFYKSSFEAKNKFTGLVNPSESPVLGRLRQLSTFFGQFKNDFINSENLRSSLILAIGLTTFVGFYQTSLSWKLIVTTGLDAIAITPLMSYLFLGLAGSVFIMQIPLIRSNSFRNLLLKANPVCIMISMGFYIFSQNIGAVALCIAFLAIPLASLPAFYLKAGLGKVDRGRKQSYFLMAHSIGYAVGALMASGVLYGGVEYLLPLGAASCALLLTRTFSLSKNIYQKGLAYVS